MSQPAAPQPASESTRTFARILGPFFAIISITAVTRSADMRELLADFESTPIWSWVVGAAIAEKTIGAEALWRSAFAVIALLGLYLAWVGWVPAAKPPRLRVGGAAAH